MASFYEFFAGGGMARAGLGETWNCLFANDFDPKKGLSYQANWGTGGELHVGDVRAVTADMLPGVADLVWGSFPCQDLSLAGVGAGLGGERSGSFYPFWKVISELIADGRAPAIVAVENVCGTLTSHSGKDFEAICRTFKAAGYRAGALVINADLFVPQSRPRLFVVGVRDDLDIDPQLLTPEPIAPFHTRALCRAIDNLPIEVREHMVWWNLPSPERRTSTFAEVIEENPESVGWHNQAETKKLLDMMSPVNLAKVDAARRAGRRVVGGVYRRTRLDEAGRKVQRAEVRFDDVAGCLRTPAGGSSRQVILVVDGLRVRSRLISSRETARLMGLDDNYRLPRNYNEAYHLTGDGVAAPVVRYLAKHIFEPVLGEAADQCENPGERVAWRA
ncbi:cytosine methyltransferase [Phenylobacterium sp. Root77]|jgi:DNA (cytosine-5)-methyltransferase 1|uniref:DNA cytosine methyltransferase n=1 Tax=unclassified Phenylobacterium TaxID=2640670 RepID=UPI0007001626|nr:MULTISPECIES: DNA cytosine methyltransferase [unclassified Phenylobacterium]KQW67036.1 cytosine methyltransferase [Phenylobacterium sp. Root1277]KQW89729.1 cytosine methyltransferase [Phenylobacterium sp. Root1290]KRC43582.1 cytosine methyltransferase [Phenylobacterium sp. Root77]